MSTKLVSTNTGIILMYMYTYIGGSVASDIVKWLKIKTGPPAKELSTPEEAILFSSSDDVVVIGFFKEQTSDAAKAFLETAERLNVYFGISYSQEVANALEAELDTMVLFKKVRKS